MSRTWQLRCVELGRPPTTNRLRTVHFGERARIDAEWRQAFCLLAKEQRIPHLREITVSAMTLLKDRRSIPDLDGVHPAVKAALDGIVDAGVIDDDGPKYVASLTYLRPRLCGEAGLLLRISEVAA